MLPLTTWLSGSLPILGQEDLRWHKLSQSSDNWKIDYKSNDPDKEAVRKEKIMLEQGQKKEREEGL